MLSVLVREEGGFKPIKQWSVTDPHAPDECWDEVCRKLVETTVKRKHSLSLQVFLVFDREELARREHPALMALIKSARHRTLGASLFLVLTNPPSLKDIRPAWTDLGVWLRTALSGRVEDLLEISEDVSLRAPDRFLETLRDWASATQARRDMLKSVAAHRRWRCSLLPGQRLFLRDLLGPTLLASDEAADPTSDTIVVLSAAQETQREIARIARYLGDGRSRCRVVSYQRHETPFSIREYCIRENIGDPVEVGGDFELWYLLLRLNEHAGERQPEDTFSVNSVWLSQDPRFEPAQSENTPEILLTSTFSLAEVGQVQAAATEIGEIVHRIPFAMKRQIEMAMTRERLMEILATIEPSVPLLWVHMGHGDGRNGLQVPGDGDVDVETWLDMLGKDKRNKRDLRLALFLTCHSDEIARRFAEEGASVAIGFHGEVESVNTWHLAVEVIDAIVADGTRGGSILAGFSRGRVRFDAIQNLDARARAYYPRHR